MQEYQQTDEQIHALSQLPAKANRAYLPAKDDDSHTNLFFDPLARWLCGRWLESPNGKIILALNLNNHHFEWLDSVYRVIREISVVGKTLDELEAEMAAGLTELGFDPDRFNRPLHFKIPHYAFSTAVIEVPDRIGLEQWCFFRSLANDAASALLGHLQIPGEVRIWPHHFDTGVFAQVTRALGIGFGLAMADHVANAPYYYLAGYTQKPIEFDHLPELDSGGWSTGAGWQGAYLALDQVSQDSYQTARTQIHEFMLNSADWYLKKAGAVI